MQQCCVDQWVPCLLRRAPLGWVPNVPDMRTLEMEAAALKWEDFIEFALRMNSGPMKKTLKKLTMNGICVLLFALRPIPYYYMSNSKRPAWFQCPHRAEKNVRKQIPRNHFCRSLWDTTLNSCLFQTHIFSRGCGHESVTRKKPRKKAGHSTTLWQTSPPQHPMTSMRGRGLNPWWNEANVRWIQIPKP